MRREKGRAQTRTYIVPDEDDVDKLQHSDDDQEAHEGVDQLRPLRRLPLVPVPHRLYDGLRALRGGGRACGGSGGRGGGFASGGTGGVLEG